MDISTARAITIERDIKVDLHAHPHFYSLTDRPHGPSLPQIVMHRAKKGIHIAAISGCHSQPGKPDHRFNDYMNQRLQLDRLKMDNELRESGAWLEVMNPFNYDGKELQRVILVSSQEVRTQYRGLTADINVLGVAKMIEPGRDLIDTLKDAKDAGGIVAACHPSSSSGMGIEKALELRSRGLLDTIETTSAITSTKDNEKNYYAIQKSYIRPHAVSDSHHFTQTARAYDLFPNALYDKFSMPLLKKMIVDQDFNYVQGQLTSWEKFSTHKWHILKSLPGHFKNNPEYIRSALTQRKE